MIKAVQNGDVYEISFKYDPALVALIKNVPSRSWHPSEKFWTIDADKLGWLMNELKGTIYEDSLQIDSQENLNVNATLDPTATIPDYSLKGIKFLIKEGAKPYNHQLDFMRYALNNQEKLNKWSGFLLCDEPGAGKTAMTMNLASYNRKHHKFKHCLIICCVNSSKYNWLLDIQEHSNYTESAYILGTRLKKDGTERSGTGTAEKLEDLKTGHMYGDKSAPKLPYFIIMNVEGLRAQQGRKYVIADELIEYIKSNKINMIAIDEVHKNLSPSSKQGKQLLKIKKYTGKSVMWIPITGTPIVKQPTDAFLPLKLIDAHNFNSYYMWCQHFCVYGGYGNHEVMAYKNIPELKTMLQGNMLRRLKKDILDLPPKIYFDEYVDNTPYQTKLYGQVSGEIIQNRNEIMESLNPLQAFIRLRQVNGSPEIIDKDLKVDSNYLKHNAKMKRLTEILEDIKDRCEKVVIYSNWVEPLRTLYKLISKKYKVCCFTGTMKENDRQKHKQTFINNPNYTVMLGTIGALGTTHTLTCANNVIFLDEPFNPTDKTQAEDRCHRIGATKSINIYTLFARNTIDDRVHNILYTKESISNYIVDNKLDIKKNPELFDLLLSNK